MNAIDQPPPLDPFPWYQQMRADAPIARDPRSGLWNVFRYSGVKRVLSDYPIFSSDSASGRSSESLFSASMISTDPPRHRQLRSLASQAFTPRRVEALAGRIEAIARQLLDALAGRPTIDIMGDFANILPVIVIAEMLGVPAADRALFKRWSDQIVSEVSGRDGMPDATRRAHAELGAYFSGMINERRAAARTSSPAAGDDLISSLLAAEIDGVSLTDHELLGFCGLLLVAGNETTTNLIGNALWTLMEYPAAFAELRADRDLLPQAIEEALRFRSPVKAMFRHTLRDVELEGQAIPAGAGVLAWIGSANRDEAVFPAGESFDLRRQTGAHIAFGYGIHYCLGAPLARLEGKIALAALFDRYASISMDGAPTPGRSMITFGLTSLPVAVVAAD